MPKHVAFPLGTWITLNEDLRGDRSMRVMFDHLAEALSACAGIK